MYFYVKIEPEMISYFLSWKVGLEALNEHLQEIKVEVVYRDRRLQFRPQIEEIRLKLLLITLFRVQF